MVPVKGKTVREFLGKRQNASADAVDRARALGFSRRIPQQPAVKETLLRRLRYGQCSIFDTRRERVPAMRSQCCRYGCRVEHSFRHQAARSIACTRRIISAPNETYACAPLDARS